MLLDEFVDFRVRAGEDERSVVERERTRRVREHGAWLRSLRGSRGASSAGAPVEAAGRADVVAPPAAEVVAEPERELAHAGR